MFKIMKWTGLTFGGLIGLTLVAGLALYPLGLNKLNQTYPNIAAERVTVPTSAEAVARGRHLAVIWACTTCHGADLSGSLITKDPVTGAVPIIGAIPAANLTSGKGGIGKSYADTDWVRAIRHGIRPDHRSEIFMYAYYSTMSDHDLGDLISYLKQVPAVDAEYPAVNYGPIIPIAPVVGLLTPAADVIDHGAPRPTEPLPGATIGYGRYLSVLCTRCHSNSVGRTLTKWTQAEFVRTLQTGVLPNGKPLGPTMSSKALSEMTVSELGALWLYFTQAKP